jgi:hypothetical protein
VRTGGAVRAAARAGVVVGPAVGSWVNVVGSIVRLPGVLPGRRSIGACLEPELNLPLCGG